MRQSNYDKFPRVEVPCSGEVCWTGWTEIAERLQRAITSRVARKTVLVLECYTGVHEDRVLEELSHLLKPAMVVDARTAMLKPDQVDRLVRPFLGGEDPVFGFLSGLQLPDFFDQDGLDKLRCCVAEQESGLVLIAGCGATLIAEGDILVYADLARWEAQLRFRRKETSNLGAENRGMNPGLQYKRAFFVDWRVCDRWKQALIPRWDFLLDTHDQNTPKMADGATVRRGFQEAVSRPFRVVPFFDPAPWGGQWMKEACDLDRSVANYGWCFDCVPEENSLLLDLGRAVLEVPSINLVFDQPRALLGESVLTRFGEEFPIRFDFLDTMGGGNLSFQVHPLTQYIREHFGVSYTQDESYYILDAGPTASVYLGLKESVDRGAMVRDLAEARLGKKAFAAELYSNRWPARKHDHFLIPAGTVHCSGAEAMVLEISATPYIFTFKMWDWGRLGLDGKPRPIHLDHAVANIQWERDTEWTRRNLISRVQPVGRGPGWREERTGLHDLEFIETRRHWFTSGVQHDTQGNLNVLNLVQGEAVVVESPESKFKPFVVHYAETFIIPAAVGQYCITPLNQDGRAEFATMKAYVRS